MTNFEKALSLCRGWYQEQYVCGIARCSGTDLTGTARKYSGRKYPVVSPPLFED